MIILFIYLLAPYTICNLVDLWSLQTSAWSVNLNFIDLHHRDGSEMVWLNMVFLQLVWWCVCGMGPGVGEGLITARNLFGLLHGKCSLYILYVWCVRSAREETPHSTQTSLKLYNILLKLYFVLKLYFYIVPSERT